MYLENVEASLFNDIIIVSKESGHYFFFFFLSSFSLKINVNTHMILYFLLQNNLLKISLS